MATRQQIARLEQRIDELAQAAGVGAMVHLFGWGNETEEEVIARSLPYRPALANTPRHLIQFTFFTWLTCEEAVGRGWEAGPDGGHSVNWQREGSNGYKS